MHANQSDGLQYFCRGDKWKYSMLPDLFPRCGWEGSGCARLATPLVMHAQASNYEASRTKCGSCCKGHEIRYYWYTSNFLKVCKFTPKTITPKKENIQSQ